MWELKTLLLERLAEAERGDVIERSITEIANEILRQDATE